MSALGLSVLGVILVWSASLSVDGGQMARRQAVSLAMALALAYVLSRADARVLRTWAIPIYVAAILGLLLTFSPLGLEISGARAWVLLPGGLTLQPAEFAKLALIIMSAAILSRPRAGDSGATIGEVGLTLAAAAPLGVLVLAQHDSGTAMVMGCIVAVMLLISGASMKVLLPLAALVIAGVYGILNSDVLAPYQIDRLTAFLDPEADPLGFGHNTLQARIAIGSGGLSGLGLGNGTQTQGGFVPVNESDFVYTVAVEELGLLGGLGIVLLLSLVLWRGIVIAFKAQDAFGRCVAGGVVAWFAFQGYESIGMTLGITPVTGVTLPFVSFGGTSMIATWLGIGLLQAVRMSEQRTTRGTAERVDADVADEGDLALVDPAETIVITEP